MIAGQAAAARVMDVEVVGPPPEVPALDPGGRRIGRAWLLVRVETEPVGSLMVEVPPGGLAGAEVGSLVDAALSGPIRRELAGAGAAAKERDEAVAAGPSITVVVCTRGRPESLVRCLESVFVQEYRRFRVLVVDNAPGDGACPAAIRASSRPELVEYVAAPVAGLSHARNVALAAARGETLAWIDDDEVADPYWLCGIARALLRHPAASVVSGPVIPAELETPAQVWFEQFGGHSKGRGFTPAVFSPATARTQSPLYPLPPFGAGANLATRPGVLEAIGGFDPALGAGTRSRAGEDTLALTELLLSGATIVYQPPALVRHYHRRDLPGLRRQLVGYGIGLTAAYTALVLRHPGVVPRLAALLPTALRDVTGHHPGPRTAGLAVDFPAELLRANVRGMLRGPGAYLHARLSSRPARRAAGTPARPEVRT